jgi:hypothetical protein
MALLISFENSVIQLSIIGCHNGDCKTKSSSCGEVEVIKETFHPYVATPITRLFLHIKFGRKYKIDELISKFDEYFANGKNNQVSGIGYFKKIILEELEKDPGWKICPKCYVEYKENYCNFSNINYIVPNADLCIFHKTK